MSTVKQYEALLNNPNIRRALDIIAASEKADYNTTFGGGTFDDFSRHPNIQKKFRQKDGKVNSSGAAGRYQFLKGTWDDLRKQYGLTDFSPRNQDIGAIALLDRAKGKDGKSALQSALEGDFTSMVEKSGSTWASFPSAPSKYSQPKHGWNKMNKIIANAGGTPLPESQATAMTASQGAEYSEQHRYNTGIQNPVYGVTEDDSTRELQAELFNFNSDQQQTTPFADVFKVADPTQVATVQQTQFVDIPEVYNQAIENAFGDGDSNGLFGHEIDAALRGVFDVA